MEALEPVEIVHAGRRLRGELARPSAGADDNLPAVLVMASAYGLGEQVRNTARELARRGWIGLCTDMYGDGAFHGVPAAAGDDFASLLAAPDLLRERVVAWFDAVRALPGADPSRIAAIGYCFGGRCVLELARSGADVKAVGSFHGLLTTHAPATPGSIKGIVVAWCGGGDPYAPCEDIAAFEAEMAAASARVQLTVFSHAEHGFTDPDAARAGRPGIAYDALADRVSHAGTYALLEQLFAG